MNSRRINCRCLIDVYLLYRIELGSCHARFKLITFALVSGNVPNSSNKAPLVKGFVSKPAVSIQMQKETIVTKAPVKR